MKRIVCRALGLGVVAASLTVPIGSSPAYAEPAPAPLDLDTFTTETTEVHQLPDGTLELTSYRDAVRVKRGGEWVAIDTDLKRTDAGRLTPNATASHVTFSAGGTGPLVTMGQGDEKFAVTWDTPLPEPVIDGNAVTYSAVRPDTDLVLTATNTGFTQVFVIKNEAAARGLMAEPIELTASSAKLRFEPHEDGSMDVVDTEGDVVHDGAAPVMWDSSGTDAPSAQDPAEGVISDVATDVEGTESSVTTTLSPPADAVNDPETEYPLFLDPPYDEHVNYYRTVHKNGWNYSDAAQPMRVGNCGWSDCNNATQGIARSYFQFNVMALRNGFRNSPAKIFDATLSVKQIHNATTAAQPVELHRTPAIPNSWPGTIGALIETKSSAGGGGNNPDAMVNFTGANMTTYLQSYANGTDNDLGIRFALQSPNEANRDQWKKFDNNPRLTVKYAYAPTVPFLSIGSSHSCGVTYTDSAPRLQATSTEIENTTLSYEFQFDNLATTAVPDSTATRDGIASNVAAVWAQSGLADGKYRFRARAIKYAAGSSGDSQPSAWSGWFEFTVDKTPPAGVPEVYSPTHPEGSHWGDATNAQAKFMLAGASDAIEFNWAIDNESPNLENNNCATKVGGPTDRKGIVPAGTELAISGLPAGAHSLKVRAVDAARNPGPVQTYHFMVAPSRNKPDGTTASGINRREFESMSGIAVDPTTTEVKIEAMWVASGQGSTVVTQQASPTAPAVARYTFTPDVNGSHALGIRYLTNAFGGVFRIAITDPGEDPTVETDDVERRFYNDSDGDGTASEVTVSTYASGTTSFGAIRYANFTDYLSGDGLPLKAGRTYTLDVELITGGGGIAQFAFLDALVLAPIQEAPFDSLEATFNNQALQHGPEPVYGFELQQSGTKAITASSLASGSEPFSGSPFTVGSTTFSVPETQHRPKESSPFGREIPAADNTVANGQTIKLPANTKGRYLDLLVTSTCMEITDLTSRALSLSVTRMNEANKPEKVSLDYQLRKVPHWLDQNPTGVTSTAVKDVVEVTPVGASQNQPKAHLYVLRYTLADNDKIYPNEVIETITLPNIGTIPGTPCGQNGSQALHIFAMKITE